MISFFQILFTSSSFLSFTYFYLLLFGGGMCEWHEIDITVTLPDTFLVFFVFFCRQVGLFNFFKKLLFCQFCSVIILKRYCFLSELWLSINTIFPLKFINLISFLKNKLFCWFKHYSMIKIVLLGQWFNTTI